METPAEEKAMQQSILEAIEGGKVKIRPKWFFVLQTATAILGGVILGLFLIYVVGFMLFLLRQSGVLFAPAIGFSGIYLFFELLPWLLVVLSLVLLLGLVLFVSHYPFAYHRPIMYSLLGIFIVVTIISFFITFLPFDTGFLGYTNLSSVGGHYNDYAAGELSGVHSGEIMAIVANGFVLQGLSGETSTVLFVGGISPSDIGNGLQAGDRVVVFGERDSNGFIEASAIEKVPQLF